MLTINWFDFITPTTPFASIIFGLVFTLIIGLIVWFDTKEKKTTSLIMLTSLLIVFTGVYLLKSIGFYG
ncbi:hypothetical protein ACFFJI_07150 [Allobacillus sp. GCM10007491]|uniref:Uncharacterized protein n=1 Tax=Allobacillus saliphilus TaxID=2912308 RepID=A0A941HS94_9BACI|nr:hypothetical protein [Allobacillus saliphilus]MBR7553178.1 hypothetical protein [Allobacillus saliphilus]